MQQFEIEYATEIEKILDGGEERVTRNGTTYGSFGWSLTIPNLAAQVFPMIQGRKMFINGILGEFAALVRRPKCVEDFEKWGCNYWKKWADADGSLRIDYGNAWFDFNGFDQVADLKYKLANNPTDRRMIISGWRPGALLSLPCCHYSYQFYVERGDTLHMVWTQRSVDMMIGAPSDFVLAAVWLITLANEFSLKPGSIKFDFGDCHIYEEHYSEAREYVRRVLYNNQSTILGAPYYDLHSATGKKFEEFEPHHITVDYKSLPKLDFLLKE